MGAELDTREGVSLVDTTDIPKQGVHSVSVVRQQGKKLLGLGNYEGSWAGLASSHDPVPAPALLSAARRTLPVGDAPEPPAGTARSHALRRRMELPP